MPKLNARGDRIRRRTIDRGRVMMFFVQSAAAYRIVVSYAGDSIAFMPILSGRLIAGARCQRLEATKADLQDVTRGMGGIEEGRGAGDAHFSHRFVAWAQAARVACA